jgi:hypothetical protein
LLEAVGCAAGPRNSAIPQPDLSGSGGQDGSVHGWRQVAGTEHGLSSRKNSLAVRPLAAW